MGKHGFPPRPTALKLLAGESRPSRVNRNAPVPAGGGPVMPRGMVARAQRVWHRQTEALAMTGVLTAVDVDALRCYCEAVARYEFAAEMLARSDPLLKGHKGELVRNPLHQIVRDNAMMVRQFARDLGFVPTAREGLHDERAPEGQASAASAWLAEHG